MRCRLSLLVMSAAIAVAGCGGSDDRTTSSTSPATAHPPSSPAADRAFAKRVAVRAADLPAGFKARKRGTDSPDDPCVGVVTRSGVKRDLSARYESPEIRSEESSTGDTIYVYPDAAKARKAWGVLPLKAAMACLMRLTRVNLLQTEAGRYEAGVPQIAELGAPQFGEAGGSYRGAMQISSRTNPTDAATLFVDVFANLQGRVIVLSYFVGNAAPFNPGARNHALESVTLRAAQG